MNPRPLAAALVLAVTACQGSWADQTKVDIVPIVNAPVAGLAEVSQGKQCDERSCRPQGSNVMVQLTKQRDNALYTIVVGKGRCGRPPRFGTEIARGDGATLHKLGATTHLDIPIIALTGGDYAIVVRNAKRAAVACGVIRRSGPV